MISILSPSNSPETDWTLVPLIPTQAPTGSILPSFVLTVIFDLDPASLAMPLISIISSLISGTSILKSSVTISGQLLLSINWEPLPSTSLIWSTALTLSLILKISPGSNWSRGIIASTSFPISTIILSRVTLFTIPLTRELSWDLNIETILSLSASRTFCIITCRAAWVSILPNSTLGTSEEKVSPMLILESASVTWVSLWKSSSPSAATNQCLWVEYSPEVLSIDTLKLASSWKCLKDADAIAISKALNIIPSSIPFS